MICNEDIVHLLDDEPDMLRALSRVLTVHGFRVEAHDNAAEFLAKRRLNQVGCLVLDLAMPGLDGFDVQRQLAEARDRLPIVFLTGHGDIPSSVRAMKAGADNFLTKPVDGVDLVAAVNSALNRSKIQCAEDNEIAELRQRLECLTPRQYEVFQYVIAGKMNKNIAAEIGTGEQNVKVHRRRVMRKMGVKSLADLVRTAERLGIEPAR
jgi:FixJ family two-component response regulator